MTLTQRRIRASEKTSSARLPSSDSRSSALAAQRSYVRSLRGKAVDLVVAPAFLRSVRQSGYASTATALCELIDNSLEARAKAIHVACGVSASGAKPLALSVLDNGDGMEPGMLRVALAWGGTHRESSRSGFGRFGFGLPTACLSQGRRFTVFSKVASGKLFSATLDVDTAGGSVAGKPAPVLGEPRIRSLPAWLEGYCKRHLPSLLTRRGHGTIVLIENLDSLTWKTSVALERNLDQAFGIAYRNYLQSVTINVQGRRVSPIDPLFIMPKGRFAEIDEDRAVPVPWPRIPVPTDLTTVLGEIGVRAAYFPRTFARIDKSKEAAGLNANARFAIMKQNAGLVVLRKGRQLDVLTSGFGTQLQNNDRYWSIELDFPAELDELLAVSTNKQRVTLSEPIREALRKGGLPELIEQLRSNYRSDRQPTNVVISKSSSEAESVEALIDHLPRVRIPGGPFYAPRENSPHFAINECHALFEYLKTPASVEHGAVGIIEALLSALGTAELKSDPDHKRFYREERRKWARLIDEKLASLAGPELSPDTVQTPSAGAHR